MGESSKPVTPPAAEDAPQADASQGNVNVDYGKGETGAAQGGVPEMAAGRRQAHPARE